MFNFNRVRIVAATLVLLAFLSGCNQPRLQNPTQSPPQTTQKHNRAAPTATTPKPPTLKSVHLLLGNPSGAAESVTTPDNYLMVKPQYALSYNRSKEIPNWVSWQLNKSWLGSADRQNNFRHDPLIPAGWFKATPTFYAGSGYDKGHIVPSADRTKTVDDNSSTFLMTNMMPQTPDNNRNTWGNLEDYSREM